MTRCTIWLVFVSFALAAVPARAQADWVSGFREAKRAHDAGEWSACMEAAKGVYQVAPEGDRRAGIALLGGRCAARLGTREAYAAFASAAGALLEAGERQELEAVLAALESERAAQQVAARKVVEERERQSAARSVEAERRVEQARRAEEARKDREEAARTSLRPPSPTGGEGAVGSVQASLGMGAVVASGTAYRGHVTAEVRGAWHLGRWRLDVGLGGVVESPAALVVTPGARVFVGPVYVRAALPGFFALDGSGTKAAGLLGGLGGEVGLGAGWFLSLEVDATVWWNAVSVVPVEGRVGLGWGW